MAHAVSLSSPWCPGKGRRIPGGAMPLLPIGENW
jgi:hypothetical protein